MVSTEFSELLKEMPAIAKVVNAFTSEEVQKQAFSTLKAAFYGARDEDPLEGDDETDDSSGETKPARRTRKTTKKAATPRVTKSTAKKASKHSTGSVKLDTGLDLRPKGKESFVDFSATKAPKSNPEKSAVAVYWLDRVAQQTASRDRVYTCFKDAKWRTPADMANALQVTASRHGTIDTSDSNNIKLTTRGENLVEHDLPKVKKK